MEFEWQKYNENMIQTQLIPRKITDPDVLNAIRETPRHLYIPDKELPEAYQDSPQFIESGQTISQPFIVAYMSQIANIKTTDTVLEIGTGSGYQTAVLAKLARKVYTIEYDNTLYSRSKLILDSLPERERILQKQGDGFLGWPQHAPFDVIIVTAAPEVVPEAFIKQLRPGGRMVIPVGTIHGEQILKLVNKSDSGDISSKDLFGVRFVPLHH